ncbi:MAG: hypothetical protein KDD51_05280 [Bdellovibrionales bacterium]|nr:hypothetical protein [Bdellovibrionales bacterium]
MQKKQFIVLGVAAVAAVVGITAYFLSCKPMLTIISTQARMGELEPCGCQQAQNQLGGVAREANVLKKWRLGKNSLYLSPGQLFVPETFIEYDKKEEHYSKKASYVVKAMNQLGVQAASISAEDTALGFKRLQELANEAQFPILSANLLDKSTHQPILKAYEIFKFEEGYTIAVTAVTQKSKLGMPIDKGVEIQDPSEALRPLMNGTFKGANLIVVLSDLNDTARDALVKEYPDINIVLGGLGNVGNHRAYQVTKTSMHLNTSVKGRQMARIEVEMGAAKLPFYNKEFANFIREEKQWRTERIASFREQLQTADSKEKATLEFGADKLGFEIADLEAIPVQKEATSLEYSSKVIDLDATWDKPENSLAQVVMEFKKSVHDIAVREAGN